MKTCTAILVFVYTSCLAALALGFAAQGLGPMTAVASLWLGLVAGGFTWRAVPALPRPRLGWWDWLLLTTFGLVSFRAFGWLIFQSGDEIRVLSPNNLGDIALHLNLIRNLAGGVPFWPESTILAGVPLTYPIGADLFNALLEILRWPTFSGLILTGLTGAALTAYALWRWGGPFGLAALLFNGGLAGFALLSSGQFLDYQADLTWKNLFLTMLVTQRGLLVALPAGLLLLAACRSRFFREGPLLPRWIELLLYAALPLFNVHAFLFVSLIYATIFLFHRPARPFLLQQVAAAFLPATALVVVVTGFFTVSSGTRFDPGWILGDRGGLAWIRDFGLLFPLAVILGVLLIRQKDTEARLFVFPAVAIFVLCCFFPLAPWPWDNMKLMLWSWLVVAPYLWAKVIRPLHWTGRAALCFALFFSGAVSLAGGLRGRAPSSGHEGFGYTLARRSTLANWQAATADLPYTDRFVIVPDFNHSLILLGRRVACGYDGHLWSHGLPYQEKYRLLQSALANETDWSEAAPVLGSEWLALRRDDRPASGLPAVGEEGTIYDLRPWLTPSPDNRSLPPLLPRPVDSVW